MLFSTIITAIDSHTAGEPTRIITGGIPHVPGNDMAEKKKWMQKNLDHIRRMLMWEPRGHQDMFGAVITAPVSENADVGVIFMDNKGYLDMCGHGSIGAVTVLLDTGMIISHGQAWEKNKGVILDTPAGKILAKAEVKNGRVRNVTIRNVPSFWYGSVRVAVPSVGDVAVDIAYGGNFFALVEANNLKIRLERENIPKLRKIGLEIREKINADIRIIPPWSHERGSVDLVEIYEETSPPRNVVIFGSGQVDRSPCGTGTCAKMAMLYSRGRLEVNQVYHYKGIFGTSFYGRIVETTKVAEMPAVVPEITGQAYITGIHHFVIDEEDPFKYGLEILAQESLT